MMELMKDSLARLLSQSDTGTGLYCWQRRGKHAALAAAHGLHHLHSQDHPILHRDIKAGELYGKLQGLLMLRHLDKSLKPPVRSLHLRLFLKCWLDRAAIAVACRLYCNARAAGNL